MMKDVVISMHSVHNCGTEDQDELEFSTDGYFFRDGDTYCFSYMETEVTGLDGTRTSVFVRPDEVVVDRDGTITGRMVFREKEKSSFLYETPYGTATLGISTRRIYRDFNESGGEMELDYVLDMEHTVVSKNKFHIKIEEQRGMDGYGKSDTAG
jgi:uncharacterized beta-barrel protein YwiB (DUF1934 family)